MLKFIKENIIKILYSLSVICIVGWVYGWIHPLVFISVLSVSVLVDTFKVNR